MFNKGFLYDSYWKSGFENEIFLLSSNFFLWILISKMDVKMNLRIIMNNLAVVWKKESPLKIDFSADLTHESNPTAWELSKPFYIKFIGFIIQFYFPDIVKFTGQNLIFHPKLNSLIKLCWSHTAIFSFVFYLFGNCARY